MKQTIQNSRRIIHFGIVAACGILFLCLSAIPCLAADPPKPKIAVFPIAGSDEATLRERAGFSLRAKIDREGHYEAISGIEMQEAAGESGEKYDTDVLAVEKLAQPLDADVAIWGDLSDKTLRIKIFDFRQLSPLPFELKQEIDQPTDLRFVSEKILEHLAGIKHFDHPTTDAVTDDESADRLWKENPNLVVNGDFSEAGHWERLYMAERNTIDFSNSLPDADQIVIYPAADDEGKSNKALAMTLSRTAAENNGLAALSEPISIQPDTRYRLQFRYKSDGPRLHVFVKGYTLVPDGKGGKIEREIYRRQVPPSGETAGEWKTIETDLNPQHTTFPVQQLRVDLYAYLHPGTVLFDDVMLKVVGKPTRKATDAALDRPATQP
jgi:hypothetical protein